jgi:hypothetical protein
MLIVKGLMLVAHGDDLIVSSVASTPNTHPPSFSINLSPSPQQQQQLQNQQE